MARRLGEVALLMGGRCSRCTLLVALMAALLMGVAVQGACWDRGSCGAARLVLAMCREEGPAWGRAVPGCLQGAGRLFGLDPVPVGGAARAPRSRDPATGAAVTTRQARAVGTMFMASVGEDPALFGAHSLRSDGATVALAKGCRRCCFGQWGGGAVMSARSTAGVGCGGTALRGGDWERRLGGSGERVPPPGVLGGDGARRLRRRGWRGGRRSAGLAACERGWSGSTLVRDPISGDRDLALGVGPRPLPAVFRSCLVQGLFQHD